LTASPSFLTIRVHWNRFLKRLCEINAGFVIRDGPNGSALWPPDAAVAPAMPTLPRIQTRRTCYDLTSAQSRQPGGQGDRHGRVDAAATRKRTNRRPDKKTSKRRRRAAKSFARKTPAGQSPTARKLRFRSEASLADQTQFAYA